MEVKQTLLRVLEQVKARLPESLPQTETAVKTFAGSVCRIGGFPENDSFLHAVATQIMHQDSQATSVRKITFVNALRRSIANQSAYNIISEVKERQKNEQATQAAENTVGT